MRYGRGMPTRDLTPFLDARQNQLQLEMAAGDAIDTKALGVLASDFAALLFMVQSSSVELHSWLSLSIIVVFTAALGFTCMAVWPQKYAGASTNMFEHPEYLNFTTSRLVKQLIADTELAILKNNAINKYRWKLCSLSLILTLIASIALFFMLYFKMK